MSLPFTPNDAKAIIPDPTSTLCGNFLSTLLKLPVLFYQLINYLFDSSGNPTKAFINQGLPSGSLVMSACLQAEDGSRLLCDGRSMPQASYPDLYAAIGATYGAASAGNFLLPDFRARFPVGIGTFAAAGTVALGTPGGEDKHVLTTPELPAHTHPPSGVNSFVEAGASLSAAGSGSTTNWGFVSNTGSTGGGLGHATIPPYLGVYVYIST